MGTKAKRQKSAEWVSRHMKCAMNADQARAKQVDPRMQQLNSALKLVGGVVKDHSWMQQNDPNRQLQHALEVLVHLTTIRGE